MSGLSLDSLMVPSLGRTVLVLVVGLVLITNHMWLFPHANDMTHTYERTTIEITNGTFSYHNEADYASHEAYAVLHDFNDLNDVKCQDGDDRSRRCGIDLYLLTHGPIHVPMDTYSGTRPEFVRLENGYYRRIHRKNESISTYDVKRVPPRELLATVAENITGHHPDNPKAADSIHGLSDSLAARGGTVTSVIGPEDTALGSVYLRNGTYYTVIVTDYSNRDLGFSLADWGGALLWLAGIIAVVYGMAQLAAGLTWKST